MSTFSYAAIISEREAHGQQAEAPPTAGAKFEVRDLNFWHGEHQAIFNVSLPIPETGRFG